MTALVVEFFRQIRCAGRTRALHTTLGSRLPAVGLEVEKAEEEGAGAHTLVARWFADIDRTVRNETVSEDEQSVWTVVLLQRAIFEDRPLDLDFQPVHEEARPTRAWFAVTPDSARHLREFDSSEVDWSRWSQPNDGWLEDFGAIRATSARDEWWKAALGPEGEEVGQARAPPRAATLTRGQAS